jgi:hypothetical protein
MQHVHLKQCTVSAAAGHSQMKQCTVSATAGHSQMKQCTVSATAGHSQMKTLFNKQNGKILQFFIKFLSEKYQSKFKF